jgi:hypothetical protein
MPRLQHGAALHRTESPVNRSLMVERQPTAEVTSIDERDREAACRRVVRGEQAVDAAADHEQVVAGRGEGFEIAGHGW